MLGFQANVEGQFGCKFDHRLIFGFCEKESTGLEWSPSLREYASDDKKVEHLPIKENALCSLPFLKGLPNINANIEHLFNYPKLRSFLMPIKGQALISSHIVSARKLAKRK